MSDGEIYEAAFQRVTQLVSEGNATTPVPTCPGWTVKDVVAHLAGSLKAYQTHDLDGASSPEWGERHVAERADVTVSECVEEWRRLVHPDDDIFTSSIGRIAAIDVLAHEQDIRTAIHRPGHRAEEGFAAAVELGLDFVDRKVRAAGLPALRFVTDDVDRIVGEGDPRVTLRTTTFELSRALHGRRSVDQVRALDWAGDPSPWLDVLFLFGPAEHDVME
jgi:uncharacterized protein (TIGR03083 family)